MRYAVWGVRKGWVVRMGSASGIGCRGRRAPVGCWDVVPFALIRDHFDFLIKKMRERRVGGEKETSAHYSIDRRRTRTDVANAPMQPGGTQSY